ncbi:DUF937 domain-containing protein [Hirschia baltica]|uniref:DUF937 domain-containing protein n=1 Tax=Hirschia baltica (strain ATCC 49814 / DSM 5838 / IFAM 1418) TaxID=582402 RepID=C6XLV2_HIRBI|nr:DUF937 domain-containing protein [Hirschia baltica]ACT58008.1 conserved hypothetical protein [Hirschia baltica ATCC 49814]
MAGLNLMDMLASGAGQGALNQLGKQFGLDESATQSAVKALLPAISGGLKRNVAQPGGLEALMGALQNGDHAKYLEQPETLNTAESVNDGNAILGHLLGSKEVSREVAAKASERAGVSTDLMKQLLPMVATMAMGSLAKQSKDPDVPVNLMGNFGSIASAALGAAAMSGGSSQSGGGLLGGLLGGLMGGGKQQQASANSGAMGMIGNLLDADKDGSAMDDIFEMVMKRR